MYVEICGILQWVEIEPGPSGAPVLLLVHGGPGGSTRFASVMWQEWRDHFTLVHWDQRGAGRTFLRNRAEGCHPMSFAQIVADGIDVAEHLKRELSDRPLILLGHSWGSAVGAHMIAQRPDLFAAYVATGLLVESAANEAANHANLVALAGKAENADAAAALEGLGPPPYNRSDAIAVLRDWGNRLSQGAGDPPFPRLTASPTNLTEEDRAAAAAGAQFSIPALFEDLCAIDLRRLGPRFEVPMFCFMGTHDQQTPHALAQIYFTEIVAPAKAFASLEGCHHFAHINRPAEFLALLREHVIPSVMR